ncbi:MULTISPECIES: glutathione S-transferase [unclassified Rhizobium]|jgi:glutathione S-transferase|uniref:glutathione S-transferase family protein n=1 Tax=unclassified Rhizobium TaxID=2613769 RepID=UPI001A9A1812|nr:MULTISPECIES: glutathione S-transferase [unclassified Rhizobium]MBX5174378.1 glutathione S-transferase [Rhizobium sp. NZLR1b]MBX5187092.1 glutathione S-transferase [Rhizobium sp. NZLR5]MBX5193409.1 glutathione S-transferase [Rhizobium sp. NZLR3b]MBX5205924.1 glutathione S-transferase [Rhizobium sp. NZLR1]QSZ20589.1 glutathione S-transferase [Rhizobium sp. NZLR1]
MKLYQSKGSPNSRRVRILIAEKHLDVELVAIDLGAKEQFSDSYQAVNPRVVVPTLVLDDGTAIGEVPAIQRYLDEAYPDVPLLGTTPKEKAIIAMWDRRVEAEGFASTMEAIRNTVPGLKDRAIAGPHDYEQIPALIDRSRKRLANFYGDLEMRLKDVPFVAGNAFSVADITALVTVDFATNAISAPIPAETTALKAWYDKIANRPAATA